MSIFITNVKLFNRNGKHSVKWVILNLPVLAKLSTEKKDWHCTWGGCWVIQHVNHWDHTSPAIADEYKGMDNTHLFSSFNMGASHNLSEIKVFSINSKV